MNTNLVKAFLALLICFPLTTAAVEKPSVPLNNGNAENRIVLTPDQLKGKTIKLSYTNAVYNKEWSVWNPAKNIDIPVEHSINIADDASITVPAWFDQSKTIKLKCRQVSENTFLFDDGITNGRGDTDSYLFIFTSSNSGIAYRLSIKDTSYDSGNTTLVSNIKILLTDQSKGNTKPALEEKSPDYAPTALRNKKILLGGTNTSGWAGTRYDGWHIFEGESTYNPIIAGKDEIWIPYNNRPEFKTRFNAYYYKTGPETAFISIFSPEELKEIEKNGYLMEELEPELQLIFTSPDEGYLTYIKHMMYGTTFTFNLQFKIVDLETKDNVKK